MCSRNRGLPVAGAEEGKEWSRIGEQITAGLRAIVKTEFCLCELEDPEEFKAEKHHDVIYTLTRLLCLLCGAYIKIRLQRANPKTS